MTAHQCHGAVHDVDVGVPVIVERTKRTIELVRRLVRSVNAILAVIDKLHTEHADVLAAKLPRLIPTVCVALQRARTEADLVRYTFGNAVSKPANVDVVIGRSEIVVTRRREGVRHTPAKPQAVGIRAARPHKLKIPYAAPQIVTRGGVQKASGYDAWAVCDRRGDRGVLEVEYDAARLHDLFGKRIVPVGHH